MDETLGRFVTAGEAEVEVLPWGPHEWLSRPGLTHAQQLLLVRVRMPPGQAHRFHKHPEMEEIIYVESGACEQWIGDTHKVLRPGDSAHIPPGTVHGTWNAGDETLVFLAILGPATCEGPMLVDVSRDEPWCSLRQ
tara:strand:+ start:509 stop:916 length:408 start_codon:yes stop_codon:yes gene_type:complete